MTPFSRITSAHQLSAKIEPSAPDLSLRRELVLLALSRTDEMGDLDLLGRDQVGDQPTMAATPVRLRAHEARLRLGEGIAERLLPVVSGMRAA
jgi:hypothetical protein